MTRCDGPVAELGQPGAGRPEQVALREVFRNVMASVCTPVAVVTAVDGARPHGTTVSAFASLSMTPPLLLVSLDRGSDLLKIVGGTARFGLNVLGAGQEELARRFARKGDSKFVGVQWSNESALPRIAGAVGWVACDVVGTTDGGDHKVVVGRVTAAAHRPDPPLTYWQREFGTHVSRTVSPDE